MEKEYSATSGNKAKFNSAQLKFQFQIVRVGKGGAGRGRPREG